MDGRLAFVDGKHRGKYKPKKDVPFPPQFYPRHAKPESKSGWHAWWRAYMEGM